MIPETIGRYLIERELARGGMATVYLAHDPNVKRYVAIKVLPRQFLHDPVFRRRFEREAQIIAALEHPAIVPLYDFGEQDGQPFLVMRYMSGGSLADRLKEGPLPLPEIARIIGRVAPALDRAHAQAIIHRDLKPGNILFDAYGDAFLSDFGIVKVGNEASGPLTAGETIVGTPAYMSPEQARGVPLDGRSDIYTLGAILYQMLTGVLPYRAETPMAMALKHITEPVPDIRLQNPALPAGCQAVVARAMAKDPAGRYITAGLLARDFADQIPSLANVATAPLANSDTTEVSPVQEPPPPPPSTQAGRSAWFWLGLTVILLSLLGLLLAGTILGYDRFVARDEPVAPVDVSVPSPPAAQATGAVTALPTATLAAGASATPASEALTPPEIANTRLDFSALERITADNVGELVEMARLGRGSLHELDLSPSGEQYAVASGTGVWLYDSASHAALAHLDGHARTVRDVSWAPDGRRLASAGDDGLIILWDVSTGQQLARLAAHSDWVRSVAWSPDGTQLASGSSDSTVRIWDPDTGTLLHTLQGHTGTVRSVAWAPDGTWLASGGHDDRVLLWPANEAEPTLELTGHGNLIYQVAWSPDGAQLASASADRTVRVWSIPDGAEIARLPGSEADVFTLRWLDDDRLASAGLDGQIRIWDPAAETELERWEAHPSGVLAVGWDPGEEQLISAGQDGAVRVWRPDGSLTGEQQTHSAPYNSVTWAPNGEQVAAAADDRTIHVWDLTEPGEARILTGFTTWVRATAWSPDGDYLAGMDFNGRIRVWATDTWEEVAAFRHGNLGESLDWVPNTNRLASAGRGGAIRIWDISSAEDVQSLAVPANVEAINFSPDGSEIAAAAEDGRVYVWDAAAGTQVATLRHVDRVLSIAWTPGNLLAAAGVDPVITLWDTVSWQSQIALPGDTGATWALAAPEDAPLLSSAGTEGLINVWDPATESVLVTLPAHRFTIWSLAWHPTTQLLASASGDGTVGLWGVPGDD